MYWIILPKRIDDGVVLTAVPEKGPKGYKYSKGISLLDSFPERSSAIMCYDHDYGEGIKLYDFIPSLRDILIVNNTVKTVFDRVGIDGVEYLPIRLWDHKKYPASDDYFILNPLISLNIIDMEKSEYRMDALIETEIQRIKNLVVNRKMTEQNKLFRASTKKNQIFIHDDVRVALEDAGIEGYKLFKADGWDGLSV